MAHPVRFRNQSQNEFQKVFNQLCYTRMSWEVWEDFTVLTATAISNALDQTGPVHDKREQEYIRTIKKYGKKEQILFPQLFALTVQGLEDNPKQDFLGEMFMALNLGNHWRGQVFTPYHVCEMMAKMIMSKEEAAAKTEDRGWVGIHDPACGAGATLIAARNVLVEYGAPMSGALFVAQDIDRTAALMCYIQLSLLGCAGYVVVGNSLTEPQAGHPLAPVFHKNHEVWFMPMLYTDVWHYRMIWQRAQEMIGAAPVEAAAPQEGRQGPSEAIPALPRVEPRPEAPEPLQVEETGQFKLF